MSPKAFDAFIQQAARLRHGAVGRVGWRFGSASSAGHRRIEGATRPVAAGLADARSRWQPFVRHGTSHRGMPRSMDAGTESDSLWVSADVCPDVEGDGPSTSRCIEKVATLPKCPHRKWINTKTAATYRPTNYLRQKTHDLGSPAPAGVAERYLGSNSIPALWSVSINSSRNGLMRLCSIFVLKGWMEVHFI